MSPDSGFEYIRAYLRGPPDAEEYEALRAIDASERTPLEHVRLAEAAWWRSELAESVAERHLAYQGYDASGDERTAGVLAARLAIDHAMRGDTAVSSGFLARSKRHLKNIPDCPEAGFSLMAEASLALFAGRFDESLALIRKAVACAERFDDRDLLAMSLHVEGLSQIAAGGIAAGLALMDEAMALVLSGDIAPFFTGVVYCSLIHACLELGDVRRAGEWSDAAMAWAETLPAEAPFHGECRVNRAEVARIRGAWPEAEAAASRVASELATINPGVAGVACYQVGDIHRRTGDVVVAEQSFARAHELGTDPQPGLALLRLAQGRVEVAEASLRTALAAAADRPHRARLLGAQVEVSLASGDLEAARAAGKELDAIATGIASSAMLADAAAAEGAIHLAAGEASEAADVLRRAADLFREVDAPYETARARARYGQALAELGDEEGSRLELLAALTIFDDLGAAPDAAAVRGRLGEADALPRGLTAREAEVLRLVCAGKTNRDIAVELVISEHTVSRHLQNMYAKLEVSSRAAATAFAFEHGLA